MVEFRGSRLWSRAHAEGPRPIYGLQARGFRRREALPQDFEAMAREYVEEIRRIQPHGPYHFLGWSYGGILAHSAAVLLQAHGERVDLLAMLDARVGVELPESVRSAVAVDHVSHSTDDPLANAALIHGHLQLIGTTFRPTQRYEGDMLFLAATPDRVDRDRVHAARAQDVAQIVAAWRPFVSGDIDVHMTGCEHSRMLPDGAVRIAAIVADALARLDVPMVAVRGAASV